MFFPNFESVKLNKDGDYLFLLPDKTGNVYRVNKQFPLFRMGHWEKIAEYVKEKNIKPIATLLRDDTGNCSFMAVDNLPFEEQIEITKKCSKLLGIEWETPLSQQSRKVIVRAIYFLGKKTVEDHILATNDLQNILASEVKDILALSAA